MKNEISQILSEVREGLSIAKPHGSLIYSGEQTLILLSRLYKNKIGKLLYLLEGNNLCYGIIRLNLPYKIRYEEFNELCENHKVTEEERKMWWPNKEVLYAYKFDIIESFKQPKEIECNLSSSNFVERFEFVEKAQFKHNLSQVSVVLHEKKTSSFPLFSPMKSNKDFYKMEEVIKYMFEKGTKYAIEKRNNSVRALLMKIGSVIKIYSNQKDITDKVKLIKEEAMNLSNRDIIVDAELIDGSNLLLSDMLHFKGEDITNSPWYERKSLLHSLNFTHHIKEANSIIVESQDKAIQAITFLKNLNGSEGAIIKSYDGEYIKNKSVDNWINFVNDLEATTTSTTGIPSVQAKKWQKKKKVPNER